MFKKKYNWCAKKGQKMESHSIDNHFKSLCSNQLKDTDY